MHTKGIWFAFSHFLPLDPSYFFQTRPRSCACHTLGLYKQADGLVRFFT